MNQIYSRDHVLSLILSKRFYSTLLLLIAFLVKGFSQTPAPVNAYARVTAINPAKTTLTITNLNQVNGSFGAGRQVIVLQMQDNVIGNTGNNVNFGILGNIGNAGMFEVATVQSFNTTQITLTGPLQNNYSINDNSRVQVVSFNTLGNPDFTTSRDITSLQWNGNTGGVIAFQVAGTLNLRHSIIADGAGFAGGNASNNEDLDCGTTTYITGNADYGAKGEGIYRSNGAYTRARGHILTGGGGGSGLNSAGAGGGNYTSGGNGGSGWQCPGSAGIGGIDISTYLALGNRLFMGGGGGGGQGNDGDQTAGGNGGGIIIIKANTIITSAAGTRRISANGGNADNADGSDGTGGGGAAGTIFLQVTNYNLSSSPLQIQANGGSGGNVSSIFPVGAGGGGGQGAILFSGTAPVNNVTVNTVNGTGGLNTSFFGNTSGNNGTGSNNIGVIPAIGTTLPVRLLYFAADRDNTRSRLNWTATDEANTVFHIQHSTDGTHFKTIGMLLGTGTGTAVTNYSFIHPVPSSGVNFYRLLMTETPDYVRYSAIASVSFTDLPPAPVAYPNPATDHFSVRIIDINANTQCAVVVSDLAGKTVYTGSHRVENSLVTVQTGKLPPGLYIVTLKTDSRTDFVKLIIE